MQIFSNVQTVRSNKVQDLKNFKPQSFVGQAKKGEQLVSKMYAFKKAFHLLGCDSVELSTVIEFLKNK